MHDEERLSRWRLVLGPAASPVLAAPAGESAAREAVLDEAYGAGSHGAADVVGATWLKRVRALFPVSTARVLEAEALETERLAAWLDPETLMDLTPTPGLVARLIAAGAGTHQSPALREAVDRVIREAVRKLVVTVRSEATPASTGKPGPVPRTYRNVDWRRTVRANLGRYDRQCKALVIDRPRYWRRQRERRTRRFVIAVDSSASMAAGLVHATVMASVLAELPSASVHLLLWDHRVVDVTGLVRRPADLLLSVQLGGGTLLLPALQHCAALVSDPRRTVLVVVSDFRLHDRKAPVLAYARTLVEGGIRCIGLCAMQTDGSPMHDEAFAMALAETGFTVVSTTPEGLASTLGPLL